MVWDAHSALNGLVGGVMIGLAAGVLMLFNGRIAGISGILSGLAFNRVPGQRGWQALFAFGLIAGAAAYALLAGERLAVHLQTGWFGMGLAGVLVGFGTSMAGGCTSGHGVCGLSRFSVRSLTATLVFMSVAGLTVFLIHGRAGR
ncbi:MAG: YeeE/YedE family protein [Nevskia sp.]|nr:YeeE/YedE family protein [Nevskia sp.]